MCQSVVPKTATVINPINCILSTIFGTSFIHCFFLIKLIKSNCNIILCGVMRERGRFLRKMINLIVVKIRGVGKFKI